MDSANPSSCVVCSDDSEPSYAINSASRENDLRSEEQAIEQQTQVLHDLDFYKLPNQGSYPFQDTGTPLEDKASRLVHAELFKSEMANASTDSKMELANPSIRIVCFDGSEPSYAMNKPSQENNLCIEKQAIDHQTSVLHDLEPTKLPY